MLYKKYSKIIDQEGHKEVSYKFLKMQFNKALRSSEKERNKNPNRTFEKNTLKKIDSIKRDEQFELDQSTTNSKFSQKLQKKKKSKNQKIFTLHRQSKKSYKNINILKKKFDEGVKKERIKRKKDLVKTPKLQQLMQKKKIEPQSAICITKKLKKRTNTLEKDFETEENTLRKKKKLQKYLCKKKTNIKKEQRLIENRNFRYEYYYTKPLKNVLMINLSDRDHKLSYQSNLRIQHLQQIFQKLKKINILYQQYLINGQMNKETLKGSISSKKELLQVTNISSLSQLQISKSQIIQTKKIKLREDKKKKFTIFLDLDETLIFTSSKCSNKEAVRITSPYSNQEVIQQAICPQKTIYGQIYKIVNGKIQHICVYCFQQIVL